MQNAEIKAELRDLPLARSICAAIKAPLVELLQQTDTYYKLADGRLKKRETVGQPTEFIFYHRDNQAKVRISRFKIYSASEARSVFGSVEPPVWVVVRKVREVYMWNSVRIHLDDVERLGKFLEFEALVTPQQNLARAHAAVEELRRHFQPVTGELLSVSYSDLLAAEPGSLPAAGPPV